MNTLVLLFAGIVSALAGGFLWWTQEKTRQLLNARIAVGIILIGVGACCIMIAIERYLHLTRNKSAMTPSLGSSTVSWAQYAFILGLIFVGSVSYTVAAYYHLKIKNWSFPIAFAIAVPLILIEYQFSIRGNHAAYDILQMNAVQITLITMCFYFVNAWILNVFFLHRPVVWWREVAAFLCIGSAFLLTTATLR